MQNEFQPEENQAPLAAKPAALLVTKTEADAKAVADITKRLDEITRRARRAKRRLPFLILATGAGAVSAQLIIVLLMGLGNPASVPLTRLCLVAEVIGIFLVYWLWSRTGYQFDAAEIAKLGGVQAIAPLLAALSAGAPLKQKLAICHALIELLPQMMASDTALLPPDARGMIHQSLNAANDSRLVKLPVDDVRIAMLKALEQVGAASAIPVVEKLTQMKPRTPGQKRVKQAAIECLPMLRANCGDVEAARTLLRASHAEAARPDTLLRPASGAGQTAAQELLRPSDENELS